MPINNHTINRLFGTSADPLKNGQKVNGGQAGSNSHQINGALFPSTKKKTRIRMLEKRVAELEVQNNHLVNLIEDIRKNFPHPVLKPHTLQGRVPVNGTGGEQKNGKSHETKARMTRRELEIIRLLVKGLCAKEIASALFISEATVITHKKNLKKKFEARNSVELISKAHDYF